MRTPLAIVLGVSMAALALGVAGAWLLPHADLVHAASGPCINSPCAFSINITWETSGHPDTRPGTYGNTDVVVSQVPFVNVPSGYRVQILRADGDEIIGYRGQPSAGASGYVLAGLTNTTPYQSPYVAAGFGSMGTFMYYQSPVSVGRIPISITATNGYLNADNLLDVKQAMFLDTAGVPVHMEATLILQFLYVPASSVSTRR